MNRAVKENVCLGRFLLTVRKRGQKIHAGEDKD